MFQHQADKVSEYLMNTVEHLPNQSYSKSENHINLSGKPSRMIMGAARPFSNTDTLLTLQKSDSVVSLLGLNDISKSYFATIILENFSQL